MTTPYGVVVGRPGAGAGARARAGDDVVFGGGGAVAVPDLAYETALYLRVTCTTVVHSVLK